MIIRMLIAFAIVATMIATPATAALEDHFLPLENEPVLDTANVIDADDEEMLNSRLRAFSRENGRQMAIVTVPSLHGYDIETFTNRYARFLGIGSAELDDGLVYLIAPNDRKQRIEVGYGLTWSMTGIEAGRILRKATPYFKDGDYSTGIVSVTDEILPLITPEAEQRAADEAARQARRDLEAKYAFWEFLSWAGIAMTAILLAVAGWFLATIPKRRRARKERAWQSLLQKARSKPADGLAILNMDEAERRRTYGSSYDEDMLRETLIEANPRYILIIPQPTETERRMAIASIPRIVLELPEATRREIAAAVAIDPEIIADIKPLDTELADIAIGRKGSVIRHITDPTDAQIRMAITNDPRSIGRVRPQETVTREHLMMALGIDGMVLGMVTGPDAEMRMTALRQNPLSIQYIASPTPEEVALVMEKDPEMLRYVADHVTEEQKRRAVRDQAAVIAYLSAPSDDLQAYAIAMDPRLAKVISSPNPETVAIRQRLEDEERRAREERRIREERLERERREAKRKRDEEEEEERRRAAQSTTYGSGVGYGSTSYGSSDSSSSSFSGGGGDFGGGGASGSW